MSVNVSFGGITYPIPNAAGENGWTSLTDYLVALSTGTATQTALKQAIRVATTSPVTVSANDCTIVTDLSVAGAVAVTLPSGVSKQFVIVVDGKGDAATNNITLTGSGGQLINGAATYVLAANNAGVVLQFDGTQWRVLVASKLAGGIVNADIAANAGIAISKLANGTALSVVGRAADTAGSYADIAAASDGQVLRRDGTSLAFDFLTNSNISTSAAITRTKLANGVAGAVVINDPTTGAMSSENQLATSRGGTGTSTPATSAFIQDGGNSRGAALNIGTNDGNALFLETDGVQRFQLNNTAALATGDAGFLGTAGVLLPAGTTAQRPASPVNGTIRFNSDTSEFEGRASGAWQSVGGGINEQPLKNYLKSYATASIAPGTLSTTGSTGNIATTAGLFYADATSGSAALTQSASTVLRGSFNYLTALVGVSTAGFRFVQFPAFTLEGTDLGKPVSIAFDVSSTLADGDWDVVVARYNSAGVYQGMIPVAGNASASSDTPSAKVMGGTGTQRGFFVASSTSTDLYALRFRRLAGSAQLRIDTLYVGPQTLLAGYPAQDTQSFTPTVTNTTGTVTVSGKYARDGEKAHVAINVTFGAASSVTGTLNFGIAAIGSVDLTKILGGNVDFRGTVQAYDASDSFREYVGVVRILSTSGAISVQFHNTTAEANATVPFTWAVSDTLTLNFSVPIANWSSNTTMAERAVEEYAFNTSGITAAGASDTTSFGYGAAGVLIGSIASTTADSDTVFRARFQTTIQATDRIIVEISNTATGSGWIETSTYFPRISQSTSRYGIRVEQINGTDVDVRFGNQGAVPSNATYAGSGLSWASAASGLRWRVRKVSSGAVIGGAIGARNVVGDTTGTAVPAGLPGEQIRGAQATPQALTTATALTITSITLTPGVWDLAAILGFSTTTVTGTRLSLYISTAANSTTSLVAVDATANSPTVPTSVCDQSLSVPQVRYLVTASVTVYLNAYALFSAGNLSSYGRLSAVRVG